MKLSLIQSDRDETESRLSVVEKEKATLKSDNKSLVTHISTTKEQIRQKVNKTKWYYHCILVISQELKLQQANETIETLMKEITSLKEEKVLYISYAFIKGNDIKVINIMFDINVAFKYAFVHSTYKQEQKYTFKFFFLNRCLKRREQIQLIFTHQL